MKVLLKDGKFAGYEPRRSVIKETVSRKKGKVLEGKELDLIFDKRVKAFEALEKRNGFMIVEKSDWNNHIKIQTNES